MISSDRDASFCGSVSFGSEASFCGSFDDSSDDASFCGSFDGSFVSDADSFDGSSFDDDSDSDSFGDEGVRSIKELSLDARINTDCASGAEATNISGTLSSFSFCLSESGRLDSSDVLSVTFLRRGGGGGGEAWRLEEETDIRESCES